MRSEQTFENGSIWWVSDGRRAFATHGERIRQTIDCESSVWESVIVDGVGDTYTFTLTPTAFARFGITDWELGWSDWRTCAELPSSLDQDAQDGLFDQLACHMFWAVPASDAIDPSFHLESWRVPVSEASFLSSDLIANHQCNW